MEQKKISKILISTAIKTFANGVSNWKTTLLGAVGLVYGAIENIDVILSGNSYNIVKVMMPHFGVFMLSLLSKDADKTGIK